MIYIHRLIKEVYDNMTKQEYKHEPYWCNKCKRFHNPIHNNQPSITHLEHFYYFSRFKKDFSQAELSNMDIKKSWERTVKTHKEKKKKERIGQPLFIN